EESGDDVNEWAVTTTPLSRLGNVQDVADAVDYLENASFVTGHTISIDGGQILKISGTATYKATPRADISYTVKINPRRRDLVSSQEEFISEIDKSIETGKSWLWGAYVRAEDGATGWSHFLGDREPTVWGGTLDGIRAMFHLGVPPLSTDLNNAINWMKGQQRPDGGFGSREMDYSSSEATSWVIITLAQVGLDSENDQVVRSAVAYLLKCVDSDGGVATTPLDLDQPRTFPA